MKKIIIFILIFVFASNLATPVFAATSYDKIGMASAGLYTSSGGLMAGKNQNVVLPLASLTKLMTALVLIDLNMNLKTKVLISKSEVDYTFPYISEGDVTSQIDLKAGDKVTKENLWYAMLIASSNEAAIALVDSSGQSRKQFVKKMNSKAKALGLTHTKFTEPTGIDPNNVGTAKEMATIARKAFKNLSIRQASITSDYKFKELTTGRGVDIASRNTSLLAMKPLGMKVGYLTEAKDNCAVRISKNGKDRVIVILHASTNARRNAEIERIMKM
jgi:serine-type D-Ala-D-Ala endopeptidase (penicillin-binding protein 7)